ncbi:MAG: phosphodiester glycosidase family protein [Gemmatimonadota bacterium]|nr:MAG: phosphodiester glycosidase family protein [Gemmatimonadota bacterium]
MLEWVPVDSLNANLPVGIRVFAGRSESPPLRAWYVRIDEADPEIVTRVTISDDTTDNRETVSSFADEPGACVAVNGGYFAMGQRPARHAGLLVTGGVIREPATRAVTRESQTYETARATIGFSADGEIDIAWATSRNDTVFKWPEPPPHRRGRPAGPLSYETAEPWEVWGALGAGPALVVAGAIDVPLAEEVFFGTSIPDVHPRTAAGRTADGALLLMVVDGRQAASRGASLEELAALIRDVGAVEALNLDGGGSSTLVVNGTLVNRPVGSILEREVMSALVTFCR